MRSSWSKLYVTWPSRGLSDRNSSEGLKLPDFKRYCCGNLLLSLPHILHSDRKLLSPRAHCHFFSLSQSADYQDTEHSVQVQCVDWRFTDFLLQNLYCTSIGLYIISKPSSYVVFYNTVLSKFPALPYLKVLSLSWMPNLTFIGPEALSGLTSLEEFYCSHNAKLERVDATAFSTPALNEPAGQTWPPLKKVCWRSPSLSLGLRSFW